MVLLVPQSILYSKLYAVETVVAVNVTHNPGPPSCSVIRLSKIPILPDSSSVV